MSIKLAVILAAGAGKRFQNHHKNAPKGFIKISDIPIIEEAIQTLISFGIERIIIATGYMSEYYDELKQKYPKIETARNPKYAESGSMYSLYEVRHLIDSSFLLLESDLIFEKRAISELLNCKLENAILISGKTNATDEVYIDGNNNLIKHITKDKNIVKNIAGELVGISKISFVLFEAMKRESKTLFTKTLKVDYDSDVLSNLAKKLDLNYHLIEDLVWSEIDNIEHFTRAKSLIYPKILENNNKYF